MHMPEAPHVLEPDERDISGVLRFLHLIAPADFEMRQCITNVARVPQKRAMQLDCIFDRKLRARADREMRGRLGVSDEHDIIFDPALAPDHRESAPDRAVDEEWVTGQL